MFLCVSENFYTSLKIGKNIQKVFFLNRIFANQKQVSKMFQIIVVNGIVVFIYKKKTYFNIEIICLVINCVFYELNVK